MVDDREGGWTDKPISPPASDPTTSLEKAIPN
jgi:hypothetical protein